MSDVTDIELTRPHRYVQTEESVEAMSFFRSIADAIQRFFAWCANIAVSSLILGVLLFIVVSFYIFSSIVNLDSFFYIFFILSLITDGLLLLIHLPRRQIEHHTLDFDATKLTIVIACYNGEEVIGETIKQAMQHVPANQILVMSDASTDNTTEIARTLGARVHINKKNINKAFSISLAMKYVDTPYVLILDDDTLIGDTFIPTSLLDEGYTAVAFNVMPKEEDNLLNKLQRFEYRKSMQVGKNLRAAAGAIGNISGAIGLYQTKELVDQASKHSGQFAGEDEQRTVLTHLSDTGKGISYTDAAVYTKAPATVKQLYRQRAYSWSIAAPELFTLYWKILLSPGHHYLLKSEKAYQLYVYLTDPLRILFFWTLIMRPSHMLLIYWFYLVLSFVIWLRLGAKDSVMAVVLFPLYSLALTICRFIGHFYWLSVKFKYLNQRMYRYVTNRRLLAEYALVALVMLASWGISINHFAKDMSLFNKIKSNRLEITTKDFNYESVNGQGTLPAVQSIAAPAGASYLLVPLEKGDTTRAVAHKAINQLLLERHDLNVTDDKRWMMDDWLAQQVNLPAYQPGSSVSFEKALIEQAMRQGSAS